MSLREDLLEGTGLTCALTRCLASPACWPASDGLAQLAMARGFREPVKDVAPGVVWLVSVRPSQREAWLWQLRTDAHPRTAFVGHAKTSLGLARRLALRDLPILATPPARRESHGWRAEPIVGEGSIDTVLDGESFGLAFALASAAMATGLRVPSDLLASAALDVSGLVVEVDERLLEDKMRLVANDALGIRRVMVAPSQKRCVEAMLAKHSLHGRVIEVLAPRTVGDAFGSVFPGLHDAVAQSLTESDDALAVVDQLWRTTLRGAQGILRWTAIEVAARTLAERFEQRLGGDPRAARRCRTVERIARRHEARSHEIIEWPSDEELRALPRPLRMELIAHVVQSAADGDDDDAAAEYSLRATAWTQPFGECHAEDLKVHGAVGRALAATGRYGAARVHLRGVVEAWFAIDAAHEASYALSELLRVSGFDGSTTDLHWVLDELVPAFEGHPESAPSSRAYVRLAAGRACVIRGQLERAAACLEERNGVDWMQYVPAEWLRARMRLAVAVHDATSAVALRTRLDELAGSERVEQQRALVRLDEAIARGDARQCAEAVTALVGAGGQHARVARRYAGAVDDALSRARWLADHSRY